MTLQDQPPPAHDPDFYHWWLSERFDHSCDLADMERAWKAGMEHANKQEAQGIFDNQCHRVYTNTAPAKATGATPARDGAK